MLWVYGNPWEGGPRYLRTHRLETNREKQTKNYKLSFSGHMSRIPDKPDPVGHSDNISSRLGEEESWPREGMTTKEWPRDVPSPPPRVSLPPALATKREALQKRPPRIKVKFSNEKFCRSLSSTAFS